MKKIMLFGVVLMSFLLVTPVMAQSRKDKKAAKKAQWEMQQQQAKEEAELLHQIKMDSIRQVQADKAAARQRAEDERVLQAQQAEADRQAALKEEAMREKELYRVSPDKGGFWEIIE